MTGDVEVTMLQAIFEELKDDRMVLQNSYIQVCRDGAPDIIIALDVRKGEIVAELSCAAMDMPVFVFRESLTDPKSIEKLEEFLGR
jgi:hypothetical protein